MNNFIIAFLETTAIDAQSINSSALDLSICNVRNSTAYTMQ